MVIVNSPARPIKVQNQWIWTQNNNPAQLAWSKKQRNCEHPDMGIIWREESGACINLVIFQSSF